MSRNWITMVASDTEVGGLGCVRLEGPQAVLLQVFAAAAAGQRVDETWSRRLSNRVVPASQDQVEPGELGSRMRGVLLKRRSGQHGQLDCLRTAARPG